MWSDLPPDILHLILLKLPVKSLIKCTALSKQYHSIITSPELINAHIKNTTTSSPTHLLLRYKAHRSIEKFVFAPDDANFSGFDFQAAVEVPFDICRGGWCNVLGSINGVICLAHDLFGESAQYVLWNPSISRYVELPRPHYDFGDSGVAGGYHCVSGFMFDPISQDYKVVRVMDAWKRRRLPKQSDVRLVDAWIKRRHTKQVEVFSMRSWCWKDLGTFDLRYGLCVGFNAEYRSCFSQGCVNWVVVCDRRGPLIMTFSMSSEEFGEMELPTGLDCTIEEAKGLQIEEFRGILGLSHTNWFAENCSLWVMKEYGVVGSWTKILDLNFHDICSLKMAKAFEILKSEEIMMVKVKDRGTCRGVECVVVVVDTTKGTERTLGEVFADFDSLCLSTYVESLVLFGL